MIKVFLEDQLTTLNAALLSEFLNFHCRFTQALAKKNPFLYAENKLIITAGTIITIDNGDMKSFRVENDIELSAADLESGVFEVGKDYYVYLVDDGADGEFVISLNSTYPAGYNAQNSRKIGGFHYGHIRKVNSNWVPIDSEGTVFGNGAVPWQDNVVVGIVPNSVWDLKNKPLCSPEGMVKVGTHWFDIYLNSEDQNVSFNGDAHLIAGSLVPKYGVVPYGGLNFNYFQALELASPIKKQIITFHDYIKIASGNPAGLDDNDKYGITQTTNSAIIRTGCDVNHSTGNYDNVSGQKPFAVSTFNVTDCVGNGRELTSTMLTRWDQAGPNTWAYVDTLGQLGGIYQFKNLQFCFVTGGGGLNEGVNSGPRSHNINNHTNGALGSSITIRFKSP